MFTPRTAAARGAAVPLTAATAAALTLQAGPGQLLARLRIGQMDCPTEETLIRKKLGGLDGVHALDFNLMQRVLTVVHADGALDRITAAIKSLGMTPEPLAENAPRPPAPAAKPVNWWAIGGAGLMAALSSSRISPAGPSTSPPRWPWPPSRPAAWTPKRAGSPCATAISTSTP